MEQMTENQETQPKLDPLDFMPPSNIAKFTRCNRPGSLLSISTRLVNAGTIEEPVFVDVADEVRQLPDRREHYVHLPGGIVQHFGTSRPKHAPAHD